HTIFSRDWSSDVCSSDLTMDPCTVEAHRLSREDRSNVFYLPPCADVEKFTRVDYSNRKGAFFLGNALLVPRPQWLEPVQRLVDELGRASCREAVWDAEHA